MQILPDSFGREVVIGSGAMGTLLRQGEYSAIACIESLNLQDPDRVKEAHGAYRDAGAQILVTNTFAASPIRLEDVSLAEQCGEINRAGVALAREAAGEACAVWGSVGPLELSFRLADFSDDELAACYREQVDGLAGADVIVLETFKEVREAAAALRAAGESGLPVVFQIGGVGLFRARELLTLALDAGVVAVGTNCSHPITIVELVEFLAGSCDLPVTAFPNAGNPHMDRGFVKYDFATDRMVDVARACLDAGASLVGGCCGTTPDHIRAVVESVSDQGLAPRATSNIQVSAPEALVRPGEGRPNRVRDVIERDAFAISVEIRPSRMKTLTEIVEGCRPIVAAGADMLDVPDNAAAIVGRDAMVTAAALQKKLGVPGIAHKSVTQTNLLNLHSYLLGCWDSGLQGLLCISGDPPATGHLSGRASRVTDLRSSVELLRLLGTLRDGELINGDVLVDPPDFCAGCGVGSGEKLGPQVKWLTKKIDAGAEFAFSQPVFSMDQFRRLRDATADLSIRLFPGVFPVISARSAEFLAAGRVPGIDVPDSYVEMLRGYEQVADQKAAGLAFAHELAAEVSTESTGLYVIMPFSKTCYADTADLVRVVREVKPMGQA